MQQINSFQEAVELFLGKFDEHLQNKLPELQAVLSDGMFKAFFETAANALIQCYLETASSKTDEREAAKEAIERIAKLCQGLSIVSPLIGLGHLNDFMAPLMQEPLKSEQDRRRLLALHEAVADLLEKNTGEGSLKEELSNIRAVEAMTDEDSMGDKIYEQFVEALKQNKDFYARLCNEETGELNDHVETALTAYAHIYLAVLGAADGKELEEAVVDDISRISKTITTYTSLTGDNRSQQAAGAFIQFLDQAFGTKLSQHQAKAAQEFLAIVGNQISGTQDDVKALSQALQEIASANPEVAARLQEFIDADQNIRTLAYAVGGAVTRAAEGDELDTDALYDFTRRLLSSGKRECLLVLGYLPAGYGRMEAKSKDAAAQTRIFGLVKNLYDIAQAHINQEADAQAASEPERTVPTPAAPTQTQPTTKARHTFPWVDYSGFGAQAAHDAVISGAELNTVSEMPLPQHRAILAVHFGEFASAVSGTVLRHYDTWAKGDGNEKAVLESLNGFEQLINYVADGKDKSSENTVERLTFLGALVALTARKTPDMGKRTKERFDNIADVLTQRLDGLGFKLKPVKKTHLFGLMDNLLKP